MSKDELLVKQANGKYCIVGECGSSTAFKQNLTPIDYINLRVNEAIRQATEDIKHAPKFSAMTRSNYLRAYDYKNIEYIENCLNDMGEKPLSQGEKSFLENCIEGRKRMEEAMEGYFH